MTYLLILLIPLLSIIPSLALAEIDVGWEPGEAVNGRPLVIKVASSQPLSQISGRLGQIPLYFYPGGSGNYSALVGIDLDEKGGQLPLYIYAVTPDENVAVVNREVPLIWRDYGIQSLTLPPSLVELDQATLRRVEVERERLESIWQEVTIKRLWRDRFMPPLDGPITGPFGLKRIINGQERAPHTGVDISASEGESIRASNSGLVVLADELFFSGKSVIIDHGLGLFTTYFHLKEFQVKLGELVKGGQIIGLVGKTGRATGPHLHWGARLNGARIDPLALVDLDLK